MEKSFKSFLITESRDAGDLPVLSNAAKFSEHLKGKAQEKFLHALDVIVKGYVNDNLYKAEYAEVYSYGLTRGLEQIYEQMFNTHRETLRSIEAIDRDAYWDMMGFNVQSAAKLMRIATKHQKLIPAVMFDFIKHFSEIKKDIDKLKPILKSGKKPKELTPEQQASQFIKPVAKSDALKFTQRIVGEAVAGFEKEFRNVTVASHVQAFELLKSVKTIDDLQPYANRPTVAFLAGRFLSINKKERTVELNSLASEAEARKLAEWSAKQTIDGFIGKNLQKLSLIFQKKAKVSEYKVERAKVVNGMVDCTMFFKFEDNSKFTVYSRAEVSYTSDGKPFMRYPTRFTDVYFADGTKMSMPSEEKMIKDF